MEALRSVDFIIWTLPQHLRTTSSTGRSGLAGFAVWKIIFIHIVRWKNSPLPPPNHGVAKPIFRGSQGGDTWAGTPHPPGHTPPPTDTHPPGKHTPLGRHSHGTKYTPIVLDDGWWTADGYIIITVYLHKPQSLPVPGHCLLRNDHRGPWLNKYDPPPGTKYTPRTKYTPLLGLSTPPLQTKYTPPRDTVNARAVCILLECNLVWQNFRENCIKMKKKREIGGGCASPSGPTLSKICLCLAPLPGPFFVNPQSHFKSHSISLSQFRIRTTLTIITMKRRKDFKGDEREKPRVARDSLLQWRTPYIEQSESLPWRLEM